MIHVLNGCFRTMKMKKRNGTLARISEYGDEGKGTEAKMAKQRRKTGAYAMPIDLYLSAKLRPLRPPALMPTALSLFRAFQRPLVPLRPPLFMAPTFRPMPTFTLDSVEAETTLADAREDAPAENILGSTTLLDALADATFADATFADAVTHAVADDLDETLADALLFGAVSDNLFRDSQ